MPRVHLGSTGLSVSVFCLDLGQVPAHHTMLMLEEAAVRDIRWWDVADAAHAPGVREAMLGEARDTLTISSHSVARTHADMTDALTFRLAALQLSYLDVMLLHGVRSLDDLHARREAVIALMEAQDRGMLMATGVHTPDPAVIRWVTDHGRADMVMASWHPEGRVPVQRWEDEMLAALHYAHLAGVGVLVSDLWGRNLPDDPAAVIRWAMHHSAVDAVCLAPASTEELDLMAQLVRGDDVPTARIRRMWPRAA